MDAEQGSSNIRTGFLQMTQSRRCRSPSQVGYCSMRWVRSTFCTGDNGQEKEGEEETDKEREQDPFCSLSLSTYLEYDG